MWITLIVLGTFLRGPNWNFFGPYEHWDAHKVEALNNVNLSEYVLAARSEYEFACGRRSPMPWLPLPAVADGFWIRFCSFSRCYLAASCLARCWCWVILLPCRPLMALTVFRGFYQRMGFIRFMIMANLLLFMASLPIKMVLRWVFNLKYLIAIPEYFFNF